MTEHMRMLVRYRVTRYSDWVSGLIMSLSYAIAVSAVALWVYISYFNTDGSFAGLWLVFVTLPISVPIWFMIDWIPVPPSGPGVVQFTADILALVLGGWFQAWLLWLIHRGHKRSVDGANGTL